MEADSLTDRTQEGPHFFDLPQEVRDMIYPHFPYLAAIHINQHPSIVSQADISKVCRRMRWEFLNVFYGRNVFFLDKRGWKYASYPQVWTPRVIFERWIAAIGDENAARPRNLRFFSHTFRVNIKISHNKPPRLVLKFRSSPFKADLAEGIPSWYSFDIAAQRAEKGLRRLLDDIEERARDQPLCVGDFVLICSAIDKIQPFLCRRTSLGYQGAALLEDDLSVDEWPDTEPHFYSCDECGYHRYTRGSD